MDERIEKQLAFALEIDKEKNIFRQTHLSGHGRSENDAEHAWHMAVMAYLMREYSFRESADSSSLKVSFNLFHIQSLLCRVRDTTC